MQRSAMKFRMRHSVTIWRMIVMRTRLMTLTFPKATLIVMMHGLGGDDVVTMAMTVRVMRMM